MRVCYIYMEKENEEERARACACVRVRDRERERERKRENNQPCFAIIVVICAKETPTRVKYLFRFSKYPNFNNQSRGRHFSSFAQNDSTCYFNALFRTNDPAHPIALSLFYLLDFIVSSVFGCLKLYRFWCE